MLNKIILITGGTGTVGSYLIQSLLDEKVKEIIIFSRNEYNQYLLNLKYPNIKYILGDIYNYERLYESTKNVDYIIHTAALKHVNIAENNPEEAININIIGSLNVIKASIENGVEKVIFISTDKSNKAECLYGSTKYISDKLCLNANNKYLKTKFSIVRFGNIFGSKGSIIEKFSDISKKSNIFQITSYESTRCFITLDKITELINFVFLNMEGGEIFIPKMKSIYIKNIPKLINKSAIIEKISFKSFEKIHEEIITENDLKYLYETDKYFIIIYNNKNINNINFIKSTLDKSINSSNCELISEEEFKNIYLLYLSNK